MSTWRLLVHALDRTGPPVLARTFLRWMSVHAPDDVVDVVALRGGAMVDDMLRLAAVHVLLEPEELWDPGALDEERAASLRRRLAALPRVDATLAVSVAAGQILPVAAAVDPLVTWVVEQGEDLHWLDAPLGLRERTRRWLAGSEASRAEVRTHLATEEVHLAPEFVEDPGTIDTSLVRRCRESLEVSDGKHLIVGAGIATHRKAPDLFLEVALAYERGGFPPAKFVWIGGESDPLYRRVREEAARVGLRRWRSIGSVADITPWLAAADVFLHTARLDAFPLVCLHAALAGTPVVTFRGVRGTDEMFGPEVVGAEYPDVAGLAARVAALADPVVAGDAAARQRRRVSSRWTAERCAPGLLAHLAAAARG